MSCEYEYERATLWQERIIKSRKPHKCDACREQIPKSTHYRQIKSLHDGNWQTLKRCVRCDAIYAHLYARYSAALEAHRIAHRAFREGRIKRYEIPMEPAPPEVLLDCGHSYREIWGEEPPPEIAALAFASTSEVQGV